MVILKRFFYQKLVGFILGLLLVSCGSQGDISGGPLDELKPIVVGTDPNELRSIKGKSIKLVFNKPVDEGSFEDYIRFYPKASFSIFVDDKTVNISIKSDLLKGKNYYLTVEKGLKCYHDIPMVNSKTLIFCNDYLATNEISGEFIFEKEEDKQDTVLLKVYDEDTVFIYEQRATAPGYQLKYLSLGKYLLRAYIDKNSDGKANEISEPYWEKVLVVNKKYLVEPIVLGYVDSVAPNIRNAVSSYSRRFSVQFDDDLTKVKEFYAWAVADTLQSVDDKGDTLYTARPKQELKILLSILDKGNLSLLTSPMQEREYCFVAKGLSDWKKNITEADTVYFFGKKKDLESKVKLVSSEPAKNSGVMSLSPKFVLKFDRLLLASQVQAKLIDKESGKSVLLQFVRSDGLEFVYSPKKELENFTSYILVVNATDSEGNTLPEEKIEFITTEKKEKGAKNE